MAGRLFVFQIQIKWGETNSKEADVNNLKDELDLKVEAMQRTDEALQVSLKPLRFFDHLRKLEDLNIGDQGIALPS